MKKTLGIADLALAAAADCQRCRSWGRPKIESTHDHGETVEHFLLGKYHPCDSRQLWLLIDKMEKEGKP